MAKWITRIVIFVILAAVVCYFGLGALMAIQGGHPS